MLPNSHSHSAARIEDRRCHAARAATGRVATPRPPTAATPIADRTAITIRLASVGDTDPLARLAQLDSGSVPPAPVLIAEEGGQLRAALSLRDGSAIADPFHRTADILELLSVRAARLRGDDLPHARRRVRGLLARVIAIVGVVALLSACGGTAAINPAATAKSVRAFVFQHTGFRPADVRCQSGIPATVGSRFDCYFTGPEGPYTAYGRILKVHGRGTVYELHTQPSSWPPPTLR